jgi:hypothetical protein
VARLKWWALAGVWLAVVGCEQHLEGPTERGKILFQRGQWRDAIKACSEAIEASPDGEAYLYRGRSFLCLGDTDRAIHDFSYAIRFDPNNSEGYYQRSIAYQQRGDQQRAEADHKMARQLDPAYAELQKEMPEAPPPHFTLNDIDSGSRPPPRTDDLSASSRPLGAPAFDPRGSGLSGDRIGADLGAPLEGPVLRDIYGQAIGGRGYRPPGPFGGTAARDESAPEDSDPRRRLRDRRYDEDDAPRDLADRDDRAPPTRSSRGPGPGTSGSRPNGSFSSGSLSGGSLSGGPPRSPGDYSTAVPGGSGSQIGGAPQSPPRPFGVSGMRSTGLRSESDQEPPRRSTGGSGAGNNRLDLRP